MPSRKHQTTLLTWLLAVVGAGGNHIASAADPADVLGEQAFFDELPVVVSVTRLPQNYLDVPASVTVLDRQMIEASGAIAIPDLLRLVAGYQVAHVSGNRWSATYHGMSDEYARRLQVLVDGRSVYLPATGGVDWADLPLAIEDIDRIEVLRGPNGVAYGANSFMGVVNIITQHASAARGTLAKVQAGDGNYKKLLLREGGRTGDLDYRLTLEHQEDDGFDDVVINNKLYSQKDDKSSNKVSLRGDYRASVNDYLTFGAGLNSGPRGHGYAASGSETDVETFPASETQNWRHYEQLKWRRIVSSEEEFHLNAYHEYSDTRARVETALLSDLFNMAWPPTADFLADQPLYYDQSTRVERYNLEFEHRLRLNLNTRLVWGAEARFDQATAEGYFGNNTPIENRLYRLFAHGEWRPDQNYLVNLGAMVEHNDITGTHISPRLAVNRSLAPGHAMRVSYTQAYRTPAMLEEYSDYAIRYTSDGSVFDQSWKSAGGLEPEQITAYELGFMGDLNGSRIQYDAKLFKEIIRDIVSYPTDLSFAERYSAYSGIYSGFQKSIVFLNRDWAELTGMETQLKLRPDEKTLVSLGFSCVYAQGTVTKEINAASVDDLNKYVPSYTVSFLLDRELGDGWRGSMALYHVDHMKFWHYASVSTMDLRLARRFKAGTSDAVFAIAAHDVGGRYFDYQDELVLSPRLYASLEFKL